MVGTLTVTRNLIIVFQRIWKNWYCDLLTLSHFRFRTLTWENLIKKKWTMLRPITHIRSESLTILDICPFITWKCCKCFSFSHSKLSCLIKHLWSYTMLRTNTRRKSMMLCSDSFAVLELCPFMISKILTNLSLNARIYIKYTQKVFSRIWSLC